MSSDYTYDEQVSKSQPDYFFQVMHVLTGILYGSLGSILSLLHLDIDWLGHSSSHIYSPPTKQR